MLLPFLVLDGFLFWIVVAVLLVLEVVAIEKERPAFSTIIVIAGVAFLQYCTTVQPISFAIHNPAMAGIVVLLYFVAGGVWIIGKWWFHLHRVRDRIEEVREVVLETLGMDNGSTGSRWFNADRILTESGEKEFYKRAAYRIDEKQLPPLVSDHKAEIYMWWLCWPLSMFWTFSSDTLFRIGNFVYNLLGDTLQRMSNHITRIDLRPKK